MKTVKMILFILLVAFIGAGVGSYASIKKSQMDASIACMDSMLYDLNIELDLLEHWKSKYENDPILEEKIKHSILNKMIAMSTLKPDISKLKGVPLEAIRRLLIFNKDNGLAIKKYDSAFNTATEYLSSIEQDVKDILDKRKDVQKSPFK
ncbi:MAG: hypothetical protein WBM78_06775 [Desulfobacterales bacterium]